MTKKKKKFLCSSTALSAVFSLRPLLILQEGTHDPAGGRAGLGVPVIAKYHGKVFLSESEINMKPSKDRNSLY